MGVLWNYFLQQLSSTLLSECFDLPMPCVVLEELAMTTCSMHGACLQPSPIMVKLLLAVTAMSRLCPS